MQLISDAGFQGEITSISTAAQQIEVFSRILKTSTANFLQSPEDSRHKAVVEFAVSFLLNTASLNWDSAGLIFYNFLPVHNANHLSKIN